MSILDMHTLDQRIDFFLLQNQLIVEGVHCWFAQTFITLLFNNFAYQLHHIIPFSVHLFFYAFDFVIKLLRHNVQKLNWLCKVVVELLRRFAGHWECTCLHLLRWFCELIINHFQGRITFIRYLAFVFKLLKNELALCNFQFLTLVHAKIHLCWDQPVHTILRFTYVLVFHRFLSCFWHSNIWSALSFEFKFLILILEKLFL